MTIKINVWEIFGEKFSIDIWSFLFHTYLFLFILLHFYLIRSMLAIEVNLT